MRRRSYNSPLHIRDRHVCTLGIVMLVRWGNLREEIDEDGDDAQDDL
jgi:hypothetical protein